MRFFRLMLGWVSFAIFVVMLLIAGATSERSQGSEDPMELGMIAMLLWLALSLTSKIGMVRRERWLVVSCASVALWAVLIALEGPPYLYDPELARMGVFANVVRWCFLFGWPLVDAVNIFLPERPRGEMVFVSHGV